MSLLADLLSKVKYDGLRGTVPPNLKQVVADSAERSESVKKIVLLSALMLFAVISGFGTVYFFKTFLKPASMPVTAPVPQPLPQQTPPPAAVQPPAAPAAVPAPAAASQFEAPVPEQKKKPAPEEKPKPSKAIRNNTFSAQEVAEKSAVNGTASKHETQKQRPSAAEDESEKKDMYLYAAKAAEARKDYQHALSNYMKILEIDPANSGNYIIMNNIAGIMIERGFYDEALHYAGNALTLKQDYVPSLVNMGIASFKLNNTADSEKYLAKALALDPSNKYALINLALLHERTSAYDRAYPLYYKLAGLGDIRGYFGLARIEEKRGRKKEAVRICREILAMNIDPSLRKTAEEMLEHLDR